MLKEILKNREFPSSDAVQTAIAEVWNPLSFDDMQNVFPNWMSHLAYVIENEG
jgi:hypothetical protein